MDDLLATHFAHLFIRDPIVIFEEDLQKLDLNSTDHFENLQSTNWQHMRFKPPPPDNDIGWRVEFRPMEIQITDFENAAFSVFIVLLTRVILSFDLNFYIPVARTTENMETAHARNALHERKFYFRKDPFSHRPYPDPASSSNFSSGILTPAPAPPVESEYELMTVNEIINGSSNADSSQGGFPGLIPLVESYLNSINLDVETRCAMESYMALIRARADGRAWTAARWVREFVKRHPDYAGDSVVGEQVTFDLVKAVEKITERDGRGGGVGWEMFGGRGERGRMGRE